MRKAIFDTERDFLNQLDGKVYAVSNRKGRIICDVLEDDYLILLNEGILIDRNMMMTRGIEIENTESDYILTKDMNNEEEFLFKEKYGITIEIIHKSVSSIWTRKKD